LSELKPRVKDLRSIALERSEPFPKDEHLHEHSESGLVIGAFHGDSLVGLTDSGVSGEEKRRASSGHVWVHPDYRDSGLGEKLFKAKLLGLFNSGKFDEVVAYDESKGGAALLKKFNFKRHPAGVLILKRGEWERIKQSKPGALSSR